MTNLNDKTVIIIPIRMSSSRLPGKFHADIEGKAMILHVIDRARESGFTNIFVACDHHDHFNLVNEYGAHAIMTGEHHQSGSDRSFQALNIIDPNRKFEYVINLQGDMPFFDPETIASVARELDRDQDADIATMAALIDDEDDIHDPNVVKVIFNKNHHALYFSRLPIPFSMANAKTEHYYHVGIYAYRREALARYVHLPQSKLEIAERLEQLRAMEDGMIIRVGMAKEVPISVDVPEDLVFAREYVKNVPLKQH
jgi:3-deoxy-manno-octulosonate cytidylyltransferase (CMP-KDO synthetase)